MKLVEIIPGLATSAETLNTTLALAKSLGKTTARSDDRPGFIANRLLLPYINEAIFALQEVHIYFYSLCVCCVLCCVVCACVALLLSPS